MTLREMLVEFHTKNNQTVNHVPTVPSDATRLLRARLMLEELGEVAIALHKGDRVLIADGLGDLAYVVLGTGVSFGVCPDDLVDIVNAQRLTENIEVKSMGILTAGVGYLLVYLGEPTDKLTLSEFEDLIINLIARINTVAYSFNMSLREIITEIHRSNMTKQLGAVKDGDKYGAVDPKGGSYSPPDLRFVMGGAK